MKFYLCDETKNEVEYSKISLEALVQLLGSIRMGKESWSIKLAKIDILNNALYFINGDNKEG